MRLNVIALSTYVYTDCFDSGLCSLPHERRNFVMIRFHRQTVQRLFYFFHIVYLWVFADDAMMSLCQQQENVFITLKQLWIRKSKKHFTQYFSKMDEMSICGISGRFPESESVQEFWENLISGKDMVTEDDRRWKPGEFCVADSKRRKTISVRNWR